MSEPKLVPLPPADPTNPEMPVEADLDRAQRYLRKLLAEGSLHPAREALARQLLREIQRRVA